MCICTFADLCFVFGHGQNISNDFLFFSFYSNNDPGSVVLCARLVRSLLFDITTCWFYVFFSCQCVQFMLHHGSYIIIEWPLIRQ